MKLATWHWHIEISSKCTLKCPRCARTEVPDTLLNTELNLEFFKTNFTEEFINTNVEKITFCGDDGDPIYARDFIEVIKYFKNIKPIKIVIVTNGSYKKQKWWQQLGRVLDHNDHIHFSLDGWDQISNEKYRVNSDWISIIQGITTLRKNSDIFMTWDTIAFSFNENNLDKMQELAKNLGFDEFQLTYSTKFNKIYNTYPENDILQPKDELISTNLRFQRKLIPLTNKLVSLNGNDTNLKLYNETTIINNTIPLCGIGNKGLFINSQGRFFPCCWVANRYNHNTDWMKLSKQFDLTIVPLVDVINNKFWNTDFENFSWLECKTKCSKNVVTQLYATEW